jgi:hypothetical protein
MNRKWFVVDNGPRVSLARISHGAGVRNEEQLANSASWETNAEPFRGGLQILRQEFPDRGRVCDALSDAHRNIEGRRPDFNEQRPHSSLDYLAPRQFAEAANPPMNQGLHVVNGTMTALLP